MEMEGKLEVEVDKLTLHRMELLLEDTPFSTPFCGLETWNISTGFLNNFSKIMFPKHLTKSGPESLVYFFTTTTVRQWIYCLRDNDFLGKLFRVNIHSIPVRIKTLPNITPFYTKVSNPILVSEFKRILTIVTKPCS